MWDPFSTTQTSRMVGITLKLINGYPSVVNAENKNTQVLQFLCLGRFIPSFENGPEFKRRNGYSEPTRGLIDSPSWVIRAVKAWSLSYR